MKQLTDPAQAAGKTVDTMGVFQGDTLITLFTDGTFIAHTAYGMHSPGWIEISSPRTALADDLAVVLRERKN